MLKVMTIVGTRPEIIRLSRTIAACDRHFDHVLVHTGQNYDYELNEIFFSDLEVRKPDHFLNAAGSTAGWHRQHCSTAPPNSKARRLSASSSAAEIN